MRLNGRKVGEMMILEENFESWKRNKNLILGFEPRFMKN